MIRSFEVQPSAQIELNGHTYDVVTEADLANALARLAVLITYAGGCGYVMPQRIPTATPNEMVTVRAIVTWQDRTNAKPKPEDNAFELPGEEVARTPEPEDEEPEQAEQPAPAVEQVLPFQTVAPTSQVAAEQLDGLQVDPLAVDESDLPAALRS